MIHNKMLIKFTTGLCALWLLSACQEDVSSLVDDKLAEIHNQPVKPMVQPLADEPLEPVVYQAGRDPFLHPYQKSAPVVTEATTQPKSTDKPKTQPSQERTDTPNTQAKNPPSASATTAPQVINPPKMVGQPIDVDRQRPLQALEAYDLHTLRYQGRIMNQQRQVALIQAPNGQLHQVQVGQYLGRNRGKIIAIDTQSISIQEAIEGADGHYYERQTRLLK